MVVAPGSGGVRQHGTRPIGRPAGAVRNHSTGLRGWLLRSIGQERYRFEVGGRGSIVGRGCLHGLVLEVLAGLRELLGGLAPASSGLAASNI